MLYVFRAIEGKRMRIIPLSPCGTIEGDFCESELSPRTKHGYFNVKYP